MEHQLPETFAAIETPTETARPKTPWVPGDREPTGGEPGHNAAGTGTEDTTASTPRRSQKRWKERVEVGEHVTFISDGIEGSGTVDTVMPDKSVIWVWADGGLGRRMLHPGPGTSLHPDHTVLDRT